MLKDQQAKRDSIESIIQHFILILIIFFEAVIKAINILIPSPKPTFKASSKSHQDIILTKESEEHAVYSSFIAQKSNADLKDLLKDIDVLSSLSKNE